MIFMIYYCLYSLLHQFSRLSGVRKQKTPFSGADDGYALLTAFVLFCSLLCRFLLSHVVSCFVMLCRAVLSFVVLFCVLLCCVVSCCCCDVLCHVVVVLCHVVVLLCAGLLPTI